MTERPTAIYSLIVPQQGAGMHECGRFWLGVRHICELAQMAGERIETVGTGPGHKGLPYMEMRMYREVSND